MDLIDLHIVRHGIAEDENPDHPGLDSARRLTAEGRMKTRQAALGMRALGVSPSRILASPFVRAQETAQIVASVLGVREVETLDALRIGGSLDAVVRHVEANRVGSLMLVGHEPGLSQLIARVVAGGGRLFVRMRKAGLVHVVVPPDGPLVGELQAIVPPSVLRTLGERA